MSKAQWRATAVAIAAAVLLGAPASDANALALGRVTVQSALGEPLRAEIDIPEINPEELSSLRASIASPDSFRAAGLEYNPALAGVTITLQRRADGRHFLQLSSSRAVNDPFVDLILETNWSSGRIVRDFTMLFDPPTLRQNAPPVQAQVAPAPSAPAATAPSSRSTPPPAAAAAPARSAPTPRAPATAAASPAGPKAGSDGKQVTVHQGDTAGKIAAAHKPANVSLDQMLVALLRANPEAFSGGNVNRLKAGAVLDMPSDADASLVPTDEAKQTLVAQSRDFNEFRRRLAEGLPATAVAPSSRQATGKVQASVEDKKGGAATPDKLTLSKGALQDKAAADKIARDRAAQDAATRVAELNKNIADLNKLGAVTPGSAAGGASAAKPGVAVAVGSASAPKPATPASAPTAAPVSAASAPKPAASAPTAAAPAPAAPVMAASAAAVPAAAAVAASAPASAAMAAAPIATTASAPASAASAVATPTPAPAAAVKPAPAKPKAAPVETTLLEDLTENPTVPLSIFGILVALVGFAFYRSQQRKKSTQVDSSFLESRLQPDSFFGASGGQRIDTNEGGSQTGSSMVYSPSQLDAAGDVDPVAEADVYLAYGRDLQAEEILKEAMRTTPQRVAVHSKLLEIYAKRRDAKAFELVATEAYGLTRGSGPEWEHICELGHELDSSNPLYRPGGQPTEGTVAAAAASTAAGNFGSTTATPAYQPPSDAAAGPDSNIDLDLDLDFSIGEDAPSTPPTPPAPAASASAIANQATQKMTAPPVAEPPEPAPVLDMDFGSATVALEPPTPQPARLDVPDLTLNENSLNFDATPPKAAAPVAAAPAPTADPGMIEFDLGSLSLDLPGATAPKATAAANSEPDTESPSTSGGIEDSGSDPLATKLALAQEFNAIGDPDGARSLAQEVIAEASGDLKSKAQRFLAEIG